MSEPRIHFSEQAATILGEELDLRLHADEDALNWTAAAQKGMHVIGEPCPVSFDVVLAFLPVDRWEWAADRQRGLIDAARHRFDQARGMLASESRRGSEAMGYGYAEQVASSLDRLTREYDRTAANVQVPGALPPTSTRQTRELHSGQPRLLPATSS